jgi:hypothetical protein
MQNDIHVKEAFLIAKESHRRAAEEKQPRIFTDLRENKNEPYPELRLLY